MCGSPVNCNLPQNDQVSTSPENRSNEVDVAQTRTGATWPANWGGHEWYQYRDLAR